MSKSFGAASCLSTAFSIAQVCTRWGGQRQQNDSMTSAAVTCWGERPVKEATHKVVSGVDLTHKALRFIIKYIILSCDSLSQAVKQIGETLLSMSKLQRRASEILASKPCTEAHFSLRHLCKLRAFK